MPAIRATFLDDPAILRHAIDRRLFIIGDRSHTVGHRATTTKSNFLWNELKAASSTLCRLNGASILPQQPGAISYNWCIRPMPAVCAAFLITILAPRLCLVEGDAKSRHAHMASPQTRVFRPIEPDCRGLYSYVNLRRRGHAISQVRRF